MASAEWRRRAELDRPKRGPDTCRPTRTWIAATLARRCPTAIRCIDPFRLVNWATEASDRVRRQAWRTVRRAPGGTGRDFRGRPTSTGAARVVKRARWALRKNPDNLSEPQRATLGWIVVVQRSGRVHEHQDPAVDRMAFGFKRHEALVALALLALGGPARSAALTAPTHNYEEPGIGRAERSTPPAEVPVNRDGRRRQGAWGCAPAAQRCPGMTASPFGQPVCGARRDAHGAARVAPERMVTVRSGTRPETTTDSSPRRLSRMTGAWPQTV